MMTTHSNSELKSVLMQAVQSAGDFILSKFKTTFKVDHKDGINNLVTEVDTASELLIINIIKKHFPDHGFIGEEYGDANMEATYKWVIDPIDGTVNFAHGVPLCCVSIGVLYQDELILGAVYNPMMQELFFAEKGKGAFLNDQAIVVSKHAVLEKAFLVTGFPYNFPEDVDPVKVFAYFAQRKYPLRRLGSAALDLCWVAAGRFDAFWEYNLQPWDIAAGMLIAQEAGAICTTFDGSPLEIYSKQLLVSNSHLHQALLNEINVAIQS